MNYLKTDEIKDELRKILHPGLTRDIVSSGFIKGITTDGPSVTVEFAPNTNNQEKVAQMEREIRDVLYGGNYVDVHIHTKPPFDEDSMMLGGASLNPLQAEMLEDGVIPEADPLQQDIPRADIAPEAGYGPDGPSGWEGPRGPANREYEESLRVFQWDIDPSKEDAKNGDTEVKLGEWEFRVWWQIHPQGELVYASMQAMREDWADHIGEARKHPVGRSEAVNLVYDRNRKAVLAIYGTVQDFRPFVVAFGKGYAEVTGESVDTPTEDDE
ncbi:MAG: DUF59 domain-containing protein [Alphaproteobacteria bacterium]|nr:DUF59 domain-containing protein [Alphaproteobacteria bacterium]MBT5860254.1 DUF59 domain-containing protein [Alphaproteobacteria bacterium]